MNKIERKAFVDSYMSNCAYGTKEDLVAFLDEESDVDHNLLEGKYTYYSSYMDALGVWADALKFSQIPA
jgi:hypothetical protein